MTSLASEFGVSGSYLSRICRYLDIPRPGLGYWAKRAAGKKVMQAPLPKPRSGFPTSWQKGVDISVAFDVSTEMGRRAQQSTSGSGARSHYLLRDARSHFHNSRKIDGEDYLRPFKKLLVDIRTSEAALDRALEIATHIFNRIETAGLRIGIAGRHEKLIGCNIDERESSHNEKYQRYPTLWSPDRPTIVHCANVAIGIVIVEMSEMVLLRYINGAFVRDSEYRESVKSKINLDRGWTTEKLLPTGRFRLMLYSPYSLVDWKETFQETNSKKLEAMATRIVSHLKSASRALDSQLSEARRRAEIAHQQYLERERIRQEDEYQKQLLLKRKKSEGLLRQCISRWAELKAFSEFFESVESTVSSLPAEAAVEISARLKLAREMIGNIDPVSALQAWRTPDEIKPSSSFGDEEFLDKQ